MRVLGIETSCDETAAAVVEGRRVLSSVVASQVDVHAVYGGVVPELAARRHLEMALPVVDKALADAGTDLAGLDGLAVTRGPGLIGCLLVGLQTAKSLALVAGKPLVGVSHVEAHVRAADLAPEGPPPYPYVALCASGGHTSLYFVESDTSMRLLGRTLDDAAGEAFDKGAKLLGLGYPGGPVIDRLAAGGDRKAMRFPIGLRRRGSLDFSFSGLKTALRVHLEKTGVPAGQALSDLCASFQEAVVATLIRKTVAAARAQRCRTVVVSGGVALNSRLREAFSAACAEEELSLRLTPPALCGDNGAMVANVGRIRLGLGEGGEFLGLDAFASLGAAG
jgi:N6-L-threonylcarbamoyladenine synthase